MKFLALATAVLPMAMAGTQVSGNVDVSGLSLDLGVSNIDALQVLSDLINAGEIEIGGALDQHDTKAISKRSDVPFLHCGYSRATRCALSSGGVLATCFWAAISGGTDIKEDSKCIAAATAFGSNLPNDCKLCLGI